MMKKRMLLLICMLIMLLSACNNNISDKKTKTFTAMGTVITTTVYGNEAEKTTTDVEECVNRLEEMMDVDGDGELAKVNKMANLKEVKISDELYYVIERCLYYAEQTNGAFDPTIGKLIDAWGIGTDHERIPDKNTIKEYANKNNYTKVELNKNDKTIKFCDDFKINLGAAAKGYAADQIYSVLKKNDITGAIVSLGGNVITIGSKDQNSTTWKVGIKSPEETQELIKTVDIAGGLSVVTSGNYERYFIGKDNKRYHHILDPHTGYPAEAGIISSTIISDSSLDADILSTSTFVLGINDAEKLINKQENTQAMYIDEKMNIKTTNNFPQSQK